MMSSETITFDSDSPESTESFGEKISLALTPGTAILLYGALGAGKTTLTRGICRTLGVDSVKSPSYILVNVYTGNRMTIYHIDLYRVPELDAITAGELAEYMWAQDAIKIIEWAERLPDELISGNYLAVKIEKVNTTTRKIKVEKHYD